MTCGFALVLDLVWHRVAIPRVHKEISKMHVFWKENKKMVFEEHVWKRDFMLVCHRILQVLVVYRSLVLVLPRVVAVWLGSRVLTALVSVCCFW